MVSQVVELLAGAVRAVLQVQHQRLQVFLLQVPFFQHLLPLLQDNFAVHVFSLHLLDLGLESCHWRKGEKKYYLMLNAGQTLI